MSSSNAVFRRPPWTPSNTSLLVVLIVIATATFICAAMAWRVASQCSAIHAQRSTIPMSVAAARLGTGFVVR